MDRSLAKCAAQWGSRAALSAAAFVANTMSAIYWSKVEFIVNLKIAKSLGLAVPNSVLDWANGVIR